jgi:archaemetzincin
MGRIGLQRRARLVVAALMVGLVAYAVLRPHYLPVRSARLEFVRLGDVDRGLAEAIARDAAGVFGVPYQVSPDVISLPREAFDPARGQYLADRLLAAPGRRRLPARTHLLAITEADLTVDEMNFVFGLGERPGSVAVMSLARLRSHRLGSSEAQRRAALHDRAVKIAVHELGHTFGLAHCPDPHCVMHYSDSAGGMDGTGRQPCRTCWSRVH